MLLTLVANLPPVLLIPVAIYASINDNGGKFAKVADQMFF
jgi:hypothetical protein